MQPRVTAILVARNGAKHLERTLAALTAQTRQPDVIVAVDCGSTDDTRGLLAAFAPTHFLATDAGLSFGAAVSLAVDALPAPEGDSDLLWLLAQDSAPEPSALGSLLGELEIAPSVAVAGPKVMEWQAGDYIHEFGQSITPYGSTVSLVESELDQGQHDGVSDVLAVSAVGMLVRHSVWEQLGGFDPALATVDDALDFCIRVRLAGYRVSLAPSAQVTSAGDGVAGLNGSSRGRWRRKRLRSIRAAQLHRRLVYAPAAAVPFHWLSLVPLALVRSIWQLLRKEPAAIPGEFAAAFQAAFRVGRVALARRRFGHSKKLGWGAVSGLRVTAAEVRRRHALRREANLAGLRGTRPEIHFFSTGGAWTLLAAALASVVLLGPLLGSQTLTGGGFLPLDDSLGRLWQSVLYGWRDTGLGFLGAADPFAAVLAVLGSLTFWAPSFALVALYFLAMPLAAMAAWMAATRLTARPGLRAAAAALWVFAPSFLTALADGRPAGILVHVLLPWLFFAGFSAARSWSASASAALLFAAIVACAPSLAPALLLVWLACVIASGRSVMRFIGIPIPALTLAAPLIWDQGARGTWLALLADPGAPVTGAPASVWQLLLGFPRGEFGGWAPIAGDAGLPGAVLYIAIPVLLAFLAIPALLALFRPGFRSAACALGAALLGFLTAIASTHLLLTSVGGQLVSVWPGSGLSLYWMGIVGAVLIAFRSERGIVMLPAACACVAVVLAVAPLAAAAPLGTSAVAKGGDRTVPAFVSAEARTSPQVGTLELVPQPDGGVLATVMRGSGPTLNDQSTLATTKHTVSGRDAELATLAGNLVSRSGLDASKELSDLGIRFVLLRPAAVAASEPGVTGSPTMAAAATLVRATTALDGNPAVAPVGDTAFGRLWRHGQPTDAPAAPAAPSNPVGLKGLVSLVALIVVFGATLLLSIPTGANQEAIRQANREAIRRAAKEKKRAAREGQPEPAAATAVPASAAESQPETVDRTPKEPDPATGDRKASPSAAPASPGAPPSAPADAPQAPEPVAADAADGAPAEPPFVSRRARRAALATASHTKVKDHDEAD